jgi:hypothetical protein
VRLARGTQQAGDASGVRDEWPECPSRCQENQSASTGRLSDSKWACSALDQIIGTKGTPQPASVMAASKSAKTSQSFMLTERNRHN